jgi:hypothetical protein
MSGVDRDLIAVRDDRLWGTHQIAAAIQRDPQATARMLRLGYLPAVKVGDRWTASAARLRHFLDGGQPSSGQSCGWMSGGSRADRWNKR